MRKISSCPSETQMKMRADSRLGHSTAFQKCSAYCGEGILAMPISHLRRKTYPTSRFLQVRSTLCFSEAIVTLWLPAGIGMDNAPFQSWRKEYPTQVSAGGFHTVPLRTDGSAVACGRNVDGACSVQPLCDGMSYTQVSAGRNETLLL